MKPVIVGVDPGGRYTGVVVRQGDQLLYSDTLERITAAEMPDRLYIRSVVQRVMRLVDEHGAEAVAVESVQRPSPFMGKSGNVSFSNVTGILGTAAVYGAVLAVLPAVEVPPGGNGSGHLAAYPIELRPTRGSGAGKDKKRHMRSAWDVAGVGALLLRPRRVSA